MDISSFYKKRSFAALGQGDEGPPFSLLILPCFKRLDKREKSEKLCKYLLFFMHSLLFAIFSFFQESDII